MPDLPTGTVSFLFTDIEGSTRLWEQHPEAMGLALADHDRLLRDAIATHGGYLFKTMGDQFCAAFGSALEALTAALEAQRALADCGLQIADRHPKSIRVRMALHAGTAEERQGDYFGPPLNRVARLLAAGHGGQILLAQPFCDLLHGTFVPGASLRDLGSHRLKDLQQPEQIYQLLHQDLPTDFPPLRSLEAFAHNLPRQLTSFIGREREVAEVKRLLATSALLALTGSGGCGKTRLALQVAADLVDEYQDGVWLAELAGLADGALVPHAVASALGVREEPGRPVIETISDYLKPKSLLVLLDNCEHLIAACAALAHALLHACPNLRILATSREALGLPGETVWRVPSLSLPPPERPSIGNISVPSGFSQYEAVRLFVDRASAVVPTYTVTPQNASWVTQVCHRLDGIPLAIELAAARVKVLSVEQIARRLDDRFHLLTGGSRTAVPRQQTLRAAIDWSYDLLSDAERVLLRRVSVFAGGWTLEAVEAVCPGDPIEEWEVLDLLTSLADKSLVLAEEQAGEVRYRLLETIRQYGLGQLQALDEAEVVRGRHLEFFYGLAERPESELKGPASRIWQQRLEIEHDNLRAALEYSVQSAPETGLRLAVMLSHFWELQGHFTEGCDWLRKMLAREAGAQPAWRARALIGAARLAWVPGDFPPQRLLLEEGLAIYRELGDKRGAATTLHRVGLVAVMTGEYELARSASEEGLALLRELDLEEKSDLIDALVTLGIVALCQGDYAAARAFNDESLATCRRLGDRRGIASSLQNIGLALDFAGDPVSARAPLEESLAIFQELGDAFGIARSFYGLGHVLRDLGEYEESRSRFAEVIRMVREFRSQWCIVHSLEGLGRMAALREQWERAARILGAVEAQSEAANSPLPPCLLTPYHRNVAAAHAGLGEEAFAAAWAEGRAMTAEQAIAYALEEG